MRINASKSFKYVSHHALPGFFRTIRHLKTTNQRVELKVVNKANANTRRVTNTVTINDNANANASTSFLGAVRVISHYTFQIL